ncbi:isoprenylcysteine carboxylmethyltransferase family protein [Candidatus Peregrinibacteria bacterium]|nr:isoprenylcysteine carboxylmethyltransferase family protein [Candidatus Peregrinibacteria bacterium]
MNKYNQNIAKKIMPPTFFMILLIFSIVIDFVMPILKFIFSPYNYIGILFIVFGIVLNLWTDSLFKKKQTTVKPHEVPNLFIDYGPFKITRHPMYLGMFFILFGTSVFLGSISSLIFPILFVIIIESMFIFMEEKNLEKKFGDEYLNYKKRVRRWI